MGQYPPPPGASDLPGLEVAGTIVSGDFSGDNPFALKPGDHVCALLTGGGYAEFAAAPLGQCLPVPRGVDLIEAAALPENFFTVWSNVFDRGRLGIGESLLVQGGSSGIGVAAIQIAHALGHPVFATAGSDQKCQACEALGARAINYKTEDFAERVRSFTAGRGADVILDTDNGVDVYRLLLDRRIDLVTFTSGSAVLNFAANAGADQASDLLSHTVVATLGASAADAAQRAHISPAVQLQDESMPAFADAIANKFRSE